MAEQQHHHHQHHDAPPPHARILGLLGEFQLFKVLGTVAELDLAEIIGEGEKSWQEVAAAAKTHPEFTHRLLRAAVSSGYFVENTGKSGHFKNNEQSNLLRPGAATPAYTILRMFNMPGHSQGWANLAEAVRTGKSGIRCGLNTDFWSLIEKNPVEAQTFNNAMTGFSNVEMKPVVNALKDEWKQYKRIVDVGGGHGQLLAAIKEAHPDAEVTSAELPNVVASAVKSAPQLAAKVKYAECDMFKSVPAENADLVLMKHILHDWGDEQCAVILKNVRKSLPAQSRLFVIDALLPPVASHSAGPTGPIRPFLMDINMMACCEGGKERSEAQWKELATQSGFKLGRIIDCPPLAHLKIVEFLPV